MDNVMHAVQRLALVFGFCFIAVGVSAQTNVESNAGVQLDFLNPGARSLGLGGAFVGLADDATAAFTNPAGLRSISRREFSLEGRRWSFDTAYTGGGRLSGVPSQLGIDTRSDLAGGVSNGSAAAASFVSFVYPSVRWAVAAYRQQLASFEYAAESSGPFYQDVSGIDSRLNPYRATLSVDIARYGVSGSYRLNDMIALGLGAYVYDFDMTSRTDRYAFDRNQPHFYAAPDFAASPARTNTQSGSDQRVGLNAGIMVTPHPAIQIGGVFRQGASFDIETKDAGGASAVSSPGTFTVPDVIGVGALVKPSEALRITADYNRVRYSQIANTFSMFFTAFPGYSASASDFRVDDANEVHLGIEYLLLKLPQPIAFRVGSWFDPDHAVRFESSRPDADPFAKAVFRPGSDVVHGTFGVGLGLGALEVNAAGDISSRARTVSISTVVRF